MEAKVLDGLRIPEVVEFYRTHGSGLRELSASWAEDMYRDGRLNLIGITQDDELIAVAWIAQKQHNVLLERHGHLLTLRDLGPFVDSGGWLMRADRQHKGLFSALAAAVIVLWFEEIDQVQKRPLWGRVMGVPGSGGTPLFWEVAGRHFTGLEHEALWRQPLGEAEKLILEHWPNRPVEITGLLAQRWEEMAHRPHPRLVGVERKLREQFGNRGQPSFYAVQSLALPLVTTHRSARNDMGELRRFLDHALAFCS